MRFVCWLAVFSGALFICTGSNDTIAPPLYTKLTCCVLQMNPNVHMHAPGMEFATQALDIVSAKSGANGCVHAMCSFLLLSGGQGLIAVCQSPTTVLGTARFLTACATNKAGNACARKDSKVFSSELCHLVTQCVLSGFDCSFAQPEDCPSSADGQVCSGNG